jgi:hypothetical protein
MRTCAVGNTKTGRSWRHRRPAGSGRRALPNPWIGLGRTPAPPRRPRHRRGPAAAAAAPAVPPRPSPLLCTRNGSVQHLSFSTRRRSRARARENRAVRPSLVSVAFAASSPASVAFTSSPPAPGAPAALCCEPETRLQRVAKHACTCPRVGLGDRGVFVKQALQVVLDALGRVNRSASRCAAERVIQSASASKGEHESTSGKSGALVDMRFPIGSQRAAADLGRKEAQHVHWLPDACEHSRNATTSASASLDVIRARSVPIVTGVLSGWTFTTYSCEGVLRASGFSDNAPHRLQRSSNHRSARNNAAHYWGPCADGDADDCRCSAAHAAVSGRCSQLACALRAASEHRSQRRRPHRSLLSTHHPRSMRQPLAAAAGATCSVRLRRPPGCGADWPAQASSRRSAPCWARSGATRARASWYPHEATAVALRCPHTHATRAGGHPRAALRHHSTLQRRRQRGPHHRKGRCCPAAVIPLPRHTRTRVQVVEGKKYPLHLVPCGILAPGA